MTDYAIAQRAWWGRRLRDRPVRHLPRPRVHRSTSSTKPGMAELGEALRTDSMDTGLDALVTPDAQPAGSLDALELRVEMCDCSGCPMAAMSMTHMSLLLMLPYMR